MFLNFWGYNNIPATIYPQVKTMDQLPSKRQSSAQDIANVDDVEKLLQKLEETIKGCTKLVGNLTEVRDDTVQCEKIARFFDAKLR